MITIDKIVRPLSVNRFCINKASGWYVKIIWIETEDDGDNNESGGGGTEPPTDEETEGYFFYNSSYNNVHASAQGAGDCVNGIIFGEITERVWNYQYRNGSFNWSSISVVNGSITANQQITGKGKDIIWTPEGALGCLGIYDGEGNLIGNGFARTVIIDPYSYNAEFNPNFAQIVNVTMPDGKTETIYAYGNQAFRGKYSAVRLFVEQLKEDLNYTYTYETQYSSSSGVYTLIKWYPIPLPNNDDSPTGGDEPNPEEKPTQECIYNLEDNNNKSIWGLTKDGLAFNGIDKRIQLSPCQTSMNRPVVKEHEFTHCGCFVNETDCGNCCVDCCNIGKFILQKYA